MKILSKPAFEDSTKNSSWAHLCDQTTLGYSLEKNRHGDFSIYSQNDGHVRVSMWLHCIVFRWLITKQMPSWLSSGVTKWEGHMRVINRRMKDITFQFTVETVTLVTIYDVKKTSHRLSVLLGLCLFLTPTVYKHFFWVLTIHN